MCLYVYINTSVSQVPGDFLSGLQIAFCSHRCLLPHASMSMIHHTTATHQYGRSARTFWKCVPVCQQLSDWGDTQKQLLKVGCDFGRWLRTKLLKNQVTKTSSNNWWKKMGQTHAAPDSACYRVIHHHCSILGTREQLSSGHPSSSWMPIGKGHINSDVGTNTRQKQNDMIQSK